MKKEVVRKNYEKVSRKPKTFIFWILVVGSMLTYFLRGKITFDELREVKLIKSIYVGALTNDILSIVILGLWFIFLVSLIVPILKKVRSRKVKPVKRKKIKVVKKLKLDVKKPVGLSTQIDTLHLLLKREKEISLPIIASTFNLDRETALVWAEILEKDGLAEIKYPRFKDPTLKLLE